VGRSLLTVPSAVSSVRSSHQIASGVRLISSATDGHIITSRFA